MTPVEALYALRRAARLALALLQGLLNRILMGVPARAYFHGSLPNVAGE